jgi:hypothetical protein
MHCHRNKKRSRNKKPIQAVPLCGSISGYQDRAQAAPDALRVEARSYTVPSTPGGRRYLFGYTAPRKGWDSTAAVATAIRPKTGI